MLLFPKVATGDGPPFQASRPQFQAVSLPFFICKGQYKWYNCVDENRPLAVLAVENSVENPSGSVDKLQLNVENHQFT